MQLLDVKVKIEPIIWREDIQQWQTSVSFCTVPKSIKKNKNVGEQITAV